MQREIPYRVILPKSYVTSPQRYPVLYLLHGLFGSCENWLELTGLRDYALEKDLIIVMLEGGDGWYSDSATIENDKFESYILRELVPEIDALFRTIHKKEKRAIVGLSMGGYGSLKFACKRPDLFVLAGSMSGAFDAASVFKENCPVDWEILLPSVEKAFSKTESKTRIDNDLFEIIQQMPHDKISELPHLYLDCGMDDGFLGANRNLVHLLKIKQIQFEFYEVPGGHDWEYWDKQIKQILEMVEQKIC